MGIIGWGPSGAIQGSGDSGGDADTLDDLDSTAFQPVDADLTAIAALAPADDTVIQRKSSAWTARTPAQLLADMDADLGTFAGLTPSNDDILQRKSGAWANRTLAQVKSDLSLQPLDSDLTDIAALTPTNDDFIQRKSGVWVNRTMAQLATDLGLAAGYQPLDGDLTTIAGLTATTDSFMQAKGSAWSARTLAQVRTDLGAQLADQDLTDIAALTPTNDDVMQRKSGAWSNRTLAQLRSDLGLRHIVGTGTARQGNVVGATTEAIVATVTIPANSIGANDLMTFGCGGYLTANSGVDTWTFKWKFAGVTFHAAAATAITADADNRAWGFDMDVIQAGATTLSYSRLSTWATTAPTTAGGIPDAMIGSAFPAMGAAQTAAQTIDPTIANDFVFTVEWSTNNANLIISPITPWVRISRP